MSETVQGALIGAGGALFGVILSLIIQFLMERWKNKREKERVTLELKINTYADAIRYISIYAKLAHCSNQEDRIILMQEESKLYNRFHPIFTIIAPKNIVEQFNELRNKVNREKLTQDVAYSEIVKLLNFNISADGGKQ